MNLTYAVADLHGRDDLLELALNTIAEHAAHAPAGSRTVVFLGDYVDRGPGSRQIVERLIAGPLDGWRWLCLKGNHEDMMGEALSRPLGLAWWLNSGGGTTLASYGQAADAAPDLSLVPQGYRDWLEALPPLAVDRHRVFVHAGVGPTLPLEDQVEHYILWSRTSNSLGHRGRFVVHGHIAHRDGPVADRHSINLDTMAWATGRLTVGVFDDDREGGPVDVIEVR